MSNRNRRVFLRPQRLTNPTSRVESQVPRQPGVPNPFDYGTGSTTSNSCLVNRSLAPQHTHERDHRLHVLEMQNRDLKRANERLHALNEMQLEQQKDMLEKNGNLKKLLSNNRKKLEAEQLKVATLENELASNKMKVNEENDNKKEKTDCEQVDSSQGETQLVENGIKNLEDDNLKLVKKVEDLEKENQILTKKVQDFEEENRILAKKAEMKDVEVLQLKEKVEEVKKILEVKEMQNSDHSNKIKSLQNELDNQAQQVTQLESQLEEFKNHAEDCLWESKRLWGEEIEPLEETIKDLKANLLQQKIDSLQKCQVILNLHKEKETISLQAQANKSIPSQKKVMIPSSSSTDSKDDDDEMQPNDKKEAN